MAVLAFVTAHHGLKRFNLGFAVNSAVMSEVVSRLPDLVAINGHIRNPPFIPFMQALATKCSQLSIVRLGLATGLHYRDLAPLLALPTLVSLRLGCETCPPDPVSDFELLQELPSSVRRVSLSAASGGIPFEALPLISRIFPKAELLVIYLDVEAEGSQNTIPRSVDDAIPPLFPALKGLRVGIVGLPEEERDVVACLEEAGEYLGMLLPLDTVISTTGTGSMAQLAPLQPRVELVRRVRRATLARGR